MDTEEVQQQNIPEAMSTNTQPVPVTKNVFFSQHVSTTIGAIMLSFVAGIVSAIVFAVSTNIEIASHASSVVSTHIPKKASANVPLSKEPTPAADHILVKFKKDVDTSKKNAILTRNNMKGASRIDAIDVDIVSIDSESETPQAAVKKLKTFEQGSIEFAEPDMLVGPQYTPNDPSYGQE